MTITATQLKQHAYLLDRVAKEDIVVTKHNRPFAVIVGIDEYKALKKSRSRSQQDTEAVFQKVRGIIPSDLDPVQWQNNLREENESDPWQEVQSAMVD